MHVTAVSEGSSISYGLQMETSCIKFILLPGVEVDLYFTISDIHNEPELWE